jgi:hypothetical protein
VSTSSMRWMRSRSSKPSLQWNTLAKPICYQCSPP